jgi:ACS family D-galactonate transporter-like MFS transporter
MMPARYRVSLMLFVTIGINYLDRSNLAVVAPALGHDLSLNHRQMGWIFSAFGWSYVALQIPGGWLADRIPARVLGALVCLLWSAATIMQGFAGTFLALFLLRLLLGAFEAPAFPVCNRVTSLWYGENERARATSFFITGEFVGLAVFTFVLRLLEKDWGWPAVFFATGGLGLVWSAVWYARYRDPPPSARAAAAGPATVPGGFQWSDFKVVLMNRTLLGIYAGQFSVSATLWFFLTWFQPYLGYRHFDLVTTGWVGAMPFCGACAGVWAAGWISDFLLKRGFSFNVARKAPIIAGLLFSSLIVGANYVQNPVLVALFLSLALFGTGCSSITWVLVAAVVPRRLVGLAGGTFNFFGNMASIFVPIVIGFLIRGENFVPALRLVSAIALAGALCYLFVVGKIESRTAS